MPFVEVSVTSLITLITLWFIIGLSYSKTLKQIVKDGLQFSHNSTLNGVLFNPVIAAQLVKFYGI
jgi:hypothetical protein